MASTPFPDGRRTSARPLLAPYRRGVLDLPNRVALAPMTRARAGEGLVPQAMTETYYRQRASAGLLITEGVWVSSRAHGGIRIPGLYTEEQIEGWRRVTRAVHDQGGRIFAQLWHVGRMSHPEILDGLPPVGPSPLAATGAKVRAPSGPVDVTIPHPLSEKEIEETIADFARAARNALAAGFDGVEIHGANGYLINQFLARSANVREDRYGGSPENRGRFLRELVAGMMAEVPAERIGVRLSPSLHGMNGIEIDEETRATYEGVVRALDGLGLAYLHLVEAADDVAEVPHAIPEVGRHFRPLWSGTLILNRGFTPESGAEAIEKGIADLVAFGVPYIANPDLVERIAAGAPLASTDFSTLYTEGPKGYIDYPPLDLVAEGSAAEGARTG